MEKETGDGVLKRPHHFWAHQVPTSETKSSLAKQVVFPGFLITSVNKHKMSDLCLAENGAEIPRPQQGDRRVEMQPK
jgi:hypothetical protein